MTLYHIISYGDMSPIMTSQHQLSYLNLGLLRKYESKDSLGVSRGW